MRCFQFSLHMLGKEGGTPAPGPRIDVPSLAAGTTIKFLDDKCILHLLCSSLSAYKMQRRFPWRLRCNYHAGKVQNGPAPAPAPGPLNVAQKGFFTVCYFDIGSN